MSTTRREKLELLRKYRAWEAEREAISAEEEHGTGDPDAWSQSDDEAVELLSEFAVFLVRDLRRSTA